MRRQPKQSFLRWPAPNRTAVQMTSLLNQLLRLARCTSGGATLEAAMLMPLLISLIAGGVEFGRAYSVASTADKSMRSAARYLARMPCDTLTIRAPLACPASTAVCGWGLTNAKYLAV